MAGNGALSAIQVQGPARLVVEYEGAYPFPVVGRVRAAQATVTADLTPKGYSASAYLRAEGVVDWFVDQNYSGATTGALTSLGLLPLRYDSRTRDGKKNRHVLVEFGTGDVSGMGNVSVSVSPKFGDWGFPATTKGQMLEAVDPLSAILELTLRADASTQNPCGGPLRIFDGKQRYDLKLKFGKRMEWKSKAYKGPAIVCSVEYVEIAGFKNRTAAQKARDKADIVWATIVLAELNGGAVTPPIKLEARSKSKGKMTVEAIKLSYGPTSAR
ncbi:MAG TPA: DUF3108 domain-containing protein [Hyphomonadaceae bacterium]|jgi:hypothetical protein|nr:DUF3108 domain-containing protein [Hyphomonadaceae bacterium]